MKPAARLAAFAAVLALVFGGAALAGAAIGPQGDDAAATANRHDQTGGQHPVRGLGVAEHGLRLVVEDPALRAGRTETVRFRIVDDRGRTVRDFDVEHEKRMHLIVVRRDLTGFQHLHPEQQADGAWTTPLRLDDGGSYRLFADFAHDGEAFTLASDLQVDGRADLRALPRPEPVAATAGGYAVRLTAGRVRPGAEARLRFAITKAGATVNTEPYLGAGGHLVALREGDLAFLHVHPTEHDDAVGFAATFPTAGRYRLFLQFRHEGRVRTAAFTLEVR